MFFTIFSQILIDKVEQVNERSMRFDITPEERSTVLVNLRRLEEERQKVSTTCISSKKL